MKQFLRNNLPVIIFFLVGISATASVLAIFSRFNEVSRLGETISRDAVAKRLEHFFSTMSDFPGSAGKDILFLHALSSVQSLHNTADKVISSDVYDDFKNMIVGNGAYKDILFYRKDFDCVMRVSDESSHDSALCKTPEPAIADILKRAEPLSMNEVYISPIRSYRDIFPGGEDIPVIVYVTPVNTDCTIISIVNANYFLEEARRLSREGEAVFLLERDGNYLANPDRSKEKFSEDAGNFYKDFPTIPDGILTDERMRFWQTDTKEFTFWRVYPTESNFAIYEGANKISGENHTREYFWVMAVVSDHVSAPVWWRDAMYLVSLTIVLVAHCAVAWLSFVLRDIYREKCKI